MTPSGARLMVPGQPDSPLFARSASESLREGDAAAALRLCLEGTKHFPSYTTGILVLGRTYEALGRFADAALEYRRVVQMLPGHAGVAALLARAEQAEREELEAFAARRTKALTAARGTVTLEEFLGEPARAPEDTVEFLIRQVEEVRKAVPPPVGEADGAELKDAAEGPLKIVTATLAEIYASQGEYREAIMAYRNLIERRTGETARYERRLKELEELAKREPKPGPA